MDEDVAVMEKPSGQMTMEPEETQTVEKEAQTEPAAIKAKIAENAAKNDEEDSKVNVFGFLVQLVIVVITVHGYLEYRTFSGETENWLWALSSLLLPVINLGGVFCGLIYYWEIHWALALIITATCFFALLPKAPGYVCAVICVALFITCASYTFPERKSEAQMEREFTNDLNRLSDFVTTLPMSAGPNVGVKEIGSFGVFMDRPLSCPE